MLSELTTKVKNKNESIENMCTFMSTLPKHSKSAGMNKNNKNLVLSLKPCADEKTYYRFRLLAFNGINSDRDDPHICRFVHQVWGKDPEKGYPVLEDEIVCPVSPHVHVEGNKYNACKVCDAANKYFVAFKESNWQDKEANRKNKQFGRKYQAIVPVYVVNDPNFDGNNNKFKVLIFNDKKFYKEFRSKIEKASLSNNVFNAANAVDCCIHVAEVPEVRNEGKPTEYVYKAKKIDKIVFSNKPYDIPSITKETVDAMGFDDTYYVTSSPREILAFYNKYCTVSNDDIPDDDIVQVHDVAPTVPVVKKTNTVTNTVVENPVAAPADDIDLNDLATDPDNDGLDADLDNVASVNAEEKDKSTDTVDAEDLLAGLDL